MALLLEMTRRHGHFMKSIYALMLSSQHTGVTQTAGNLATVAASRDRYSTAYLHIHLF